MKNTRRFLSSTASLAVTVLVASSAAAAEPKFDCKNLPTPAQLSAAYKGPSENYGKPNDPLVGQKCGGVNVFGGGLALYSADGKLLGAIGVSGDTSCTDHILAWKIRHALNLDNVPAGVSATGDDKHRSRHRSRCQRSFGKCGGMGTSHLPWGGWQPSGAPRDAPGGSDSVNASKVIHRAGSFDCRRALLCNATFREKQLRSGRLGSPPHAVVRPDQELGRFLLNGCPAYRADRGRRSAVSEFRFVG